MTTETDLPEDKLREIIAGCEGVTPGPWEADGVRNEGGSGRFESYHVLAVSLERYGKQPSLVDTLNSDCIELLEDGDSESHSVWDEQGRKDTLHIARLDPATVSAMASELLRSRAALASIRAERDAAVAALKVADMALTDICQFTPTGLTDNFEQIAKHARATTLEAYPIIRRAARAIAGEQTNDA